MASQSLYRKWRSQTFDEMVGQEPIIRTLKNALKNDNLGHAYLFTGPRGTGKTSTARLLAKTVNCTDPRDGEPCNECQQCREITAGNSFNVTEIDAASNRGIDSIRELREKVMVPPASGKYKIYILDEAHMLTTEAFNALLKTLEEPPEYAIFVMATTDVHKMLPTVLSRCQRFDFKRISTRQIINHLLHVAGEEKVELEKSAAELIARTAAGGMRDALSLLDQAIAYAGEVVSLAQVQSMLGVADPRSISKMIGLIAHLDSSALLHLIHELSEAGADLRQINTQIVEYWRALMLTRAEADVATIMDLTEDEISELRQLAPVFGLEELTESARIFAQNELMQRNHGTPQLALELASLECIELHRRIVEGGTIARETQRKVTYTPPPSSPAHSAPTTAFVHETSSRQVAPAARPPEPAPAPADEVPTSLANHLNQYTPEPAVEPTSPAASPQLRGNQSGLTLQRVVAAWESVKRRTMQKGSLLGIYVGMCDVLDIENDEGAVTIVIRAAKPMHFKSIKEKEHLQSVEWALNTEFKMDCKVRVIAPDQAYTGSRAQNSSAATAPLAPAHREPTYFAPEPPKEQVRETPSGETSLSPRSPSPRALSDAAIVEATSEKFTSAPPLARPQSVSEKKKVVLSKEELRQKVQQDPVVQELQRTFRANIIDIQPK